MIEFEGKIKMIAVPIPFGAFNFQLSADKKHILFQIVPLNDKVSELQRASNQEYYIGFPVIEIIGLSSDILKSEELAKKCVEFAESKTLDKYMPISYAKNADFCWTFRDSFQSLLDKYNIKNEHLILEVR